jgi:membrane-bound inhibitor of C-type lysozyme
MNKNNIFVIILVVLLAVTGGLYLYKNQLQKNNKPVTQAEYKNIYYAIDSQLVLLKNGVAETETTPGSATKTVSKYFGNEVKGDFNGDGLEDVAFLLTQDTGGSGTFYYVVVALKKSDGYIGINGILLGDRIAPQTTEFRNNEIIVNYADRNPGEPFTAVPSVGVTKRFTIASGNLVEIINSVTFNCDESKNIKAVFFNMGVSLVLSDGRKMVIPQVISGSGARYANADESFVFWNKGDTAFVTEGDLTTYNNCAISSISGS